jgi:hypothetical protein
VRRGRDEAAGYRRAAEHAAVAHWPESADVTNLPCVSIPRSQKTGENWGLHCVF